MRAWALVLGMMLVCCAQAPSHAERQTAGGGRDGGNGVAPGGQAVEDAAPLLRAGKSVARLWIGYVPREIETFPNMAPESFDTDSTYTIEVKHFSTSKLRRELADALEASPPRRVDFEIHRINLRWACVICDERGRRVLTMYFDGQGQAGVINGIPVTDIRRVVEVLEKTCSCLWDGDWRRRYSGEPELRAAAPGDVIGQASNLLLADRGIARMEILHLPPAAKCPEQTPPEKLVEQSDYRVQIQWSPPRAFTTALASALEKCVPEEKPERFTVAWACVLYGAKDARVLTLCFDASGKKGLLNGTPLLSDGRFVQVLESRTSCLWAGEYDLR